MKRLLYVFLIILLLAGCVAGLVLLNNSTDYLQNAPENTLNISELKMADSRIVAAALRTDVEKWIELDGTVTGPDDKLVLIQSLRNIASVENLSVKIGDNVNKDDILYTNGNKEILSKVNGRIADITRYKRKIEITLVNYDCLYISAQIPQKYINEVAIGKTVSINYNDKWIEGSISFIDYKVNIDQTVFIKIAYTDTKREIKPGSFVKIKIIQQVANDVVAVPLKALIKGVENVYYVQLISNDSNNYFDTVPIEVGLLGNEIAEVISGVNFGDYVKIQEENTVAEEGDENYAK